MKKILLIISVIAVLFLTGCKSKESTTTINGALINDENIVDENKNNELEVEKEASLNKEVKDAYLNIINTYESEYEKDDIKYDLIYFNNDDIPDLVVNMQEMWVSLYIGINGDIYNPIDMWSYGAMGNTGYEYAEKSGIILNSNTDYAGVIITEAIMILNDNYTFDTYSATTIGAEIETSGETSGEVSGEISGEISEALNSYGGYYYNNEKISEEKYNNNINNILENINKEEFKILEGTKNALEIKSILEN